MAQRSKFTSPASFTAAAASGAAASAAGPVVAGEEGMSERLLQTEALRRVVRHHLLDQVEQLTVFFTF